MNRSIDYPAVILSGGKSSRMGTDKSLLPFGGCDTLIEYQYKKLQKIFKEVYISAKEDKFDFLEDKSKLIKDCSCIYSPMTALQTVFKSFQSGFVFIIAVDLPLITQSVIEKLYKDLEKTNTQIVIAKSLQENSYNLCGFFNVNLLRSVDKLLSEDIHKIKKLFSKVSITKTVFKDSEQFINLNRYEDYKKSCDLL